MPRVIQVIESYVERGDGTLANVSRLVRQFHDFEGVLLFEHDEWGERKRNQLIQIQACHPLSSFNND